MNLEKYRLKLIGSEDERAVSPVIGVILMVAITVILAAVIAAFVLDMGGSIGQEAKAGASIEVDESNDEIQIEVVSLGNADYVNVSGAVRNEDADGSSNYYIEDTNDDGSFEKQQSWDEVKNDLSELEVGDIITIGGDADATVTMGDDSPNSGTVTAVAVLEEDNTSTQVASEEYELTWDETV